MTRQQAALQGEGGVAGVLVPAGVVDLERRPDRQLAGEQQIVLAERQRVAGPLEVQGAEHLAPRDQRHGQIGVHAGPAQQFGRLGRAGDPRQVRVRHPLHPDRPPRAHALGDQAVRPVPGDLAGRVGRPQRLGRVVGVHGQGADHGRLGRTQGAAPPLDHGLQQIHRRDVGEAGHRHSGQFVRRALQLQRGADPGGGVRDRGQPAPRGLGLDTRPVLLGDVHDRHGDAHHRADGVLQPVQRERPGVLLVRVGRGPPGRRQVDHGPPRLQYPARRLLQGAGVHQRQYLADRPAEVFLGRQSVHPGQGRVDRDVPQLRVHDGEPDRGLPDHPRGQRHVLLQPAHRRPVDREPQRVDVPPVVQEAHVAELHQ